MTKLTSSCRTISIAFQGSDIRHVDIYFTSTDNAYGAVAKQWFEGDIKQLTLNIKNTNKSSTSSVRHEAGVAIKAARRSSLESGGHCNKSASFYECMATNFNKKLTVHESCPCRHLSLPNLEAVNEVTVLPECQTQEEVDCNERQVSLGTMHIAA